MKKLMVIAGVTFLASCASQSDQTKINGMANPASVYCKKVGGKLNIVKGRGGDVGYCTLPDGERIEEWTLYRRDNK
ncbi:DUF333 domain-containing protein [Mixta sp. Marseille-Q2659]|uniref:putative hemolysin n=1 Tax=Mixta sp. Marseille-Q2659 TaxID=2736607 RepID=UPI0023BA257A|nr:DUF333 domain-containing protein [Mixta sp. Marseille-Q2659]